MIASWKESCEREPVLSINIVGSQVGHVHRSYICQLVVEHQIVYDMFPSDQCSRGLYVIKQLVGVALQISLDALFDLHDLIQALRKLNTLTDSK